MTHPCSNPFGTRRAAPALGGLTMLLLATLVVAHAAAGVDPGCLAPGTMSLTDRVPTRVLPLLARAARRSAAPLEAPRLPAAERAAASRWASSILRTKAPLDPARCSVRVEHLDLPPPLA
ncbi:MAG: hypothetical protein KF745_03235 [Phycisphaeraceae bacterium]|nr:hypothetical protein [Phycisphaeraceae bacterium]